MKKLISILIVLCLAAALVPAVAEEDPAGVWYLNRAVTNGVNMVAISDAFQITITLKEDGTSILFLQTNGTEANQSVSEGTWTYEDGVVTITEKENGSVTVARYADGELTIESDANTRMILTREPWKPYEQPAAVRAESMEAFYGAWYPDVYFQSGWMQFAPDTMPPETRTQLVISADGIVERAADTPDMAYANPSVDPETGILTASFDIQDGLPVLMKLTLLEDGTMLVTASVLDTEGMRAIYRLLPADGGN